MIFEAPDKFNRYYFAAEFIKSVMTLGVKNPTILDLGSNENLLTSFLDDYPVIQADLHRANAKGLLVQCRGELLPLKSKSFDIIVCLDVLEHIDEKNRIAVLQEISRVASHTAILAFPVKHEFSVTHEKTLSDIHLYLNGEPNHFLNEHSIFTGINSDHIEQKLSESFKHTKRYYIFPNHIWFLSSLIDYFLGIFPETQLVRKEMFALINSAPSLCKNEKDSYRTFIVASQFQLPALKDFILTLPDAKQQHENIMDAFKKSHMTFKNLVDYAGTLELTVKHAETELKKLSISNAELNEKIHDLSADLKAKNMEFQELQNVYNKLERSCFNLENAIKQKEHAILFLQEKCMNILTAFINRKS